MDIGKLSFFDATNSVVRLAKTDINIFDMKSDPAQDISHLVKAREPERSMPVFNQAGPPPNHDGTFTPLPKMSELFKENREDNVSRLTREREQFYAESKPALNNSVGAPVGFNIVDDNLVYVSFPGGGYTFSAGWDLELNEPPNSPLAFETKINNLKNLFDYLSDTAIENRDVFEKAVSGNPFSVSVTA